MTSQASKITSIKAARKSGSKGMRAREALMDAGLALLSEMSPRELTAGTICIAAQMKRPSFYTYFDSVDAQCGDHTVTGSRTSISTGSKKRVL